MSHEKILTLKTIRHRFQNLTGDVIVGTAIDASGELITVKGPDDGYLAEGTTYLFIGRWGTYERLGVEEKQWHFSTYAVSSPVSQVGVIEYLKKIPGVGVVTAKRIWEHFGADSVSFIRKNPFELRNFSNRISEEQCLAAGEMLVRDKGLEQVTIELTGLFEGRGFRKNLIKKCIEKWGAAAFEKILQNPYKLMQFPGCGFKNTDAFYLALGGNPVRLKRQAMCAWHASRELTKSTGNTWNTVQEIDFAINSSVSGAQVDVSKAKRLAVRSGMSSVVWTDGMHGFPDWDGSHAWFADSDAAGSEKRLAEMVASAMYEPADWPVDFSDVSEHQKAQLLAATSGGCVAILGGGPGTGKTFCAARMIRSLLSTHGSSGILIGAPTGKAAVRLTESLRSNGVQMQARTWHSILGVVSTSPWEFEYHAGNKLEARVLIMDETSMTGTDMMERIFAARPKGCMVLMVGDINQLAPVDHGSPLRDMIAAGVPYGELTEIWRNSGRIVQVCHAIRRNELWSHSGYQEFRGDQGENLLLSPAASLTEFSNKIIRSIELYSVLLDLDPVWDCQVVVPLNAKSDASRSVLNPILQNRFNGEDKSGKFRVGDKVINLSNAWMIPVKHSDEAIMRNGFVYVANGEIGKVTEVKPKSFQVELQLPYRLVASAIFDKQPEGETEEEQKTSSWDLAYAISVHKSQGSEFPIVIVALDDSGGARRLCDRSWLYTAISRAKKLCVLVGKKSTANDMCRQNRISQRKTFLRELILMEKEKWKTGQYTVTVDSQSSLTPPRPAPGDSKESLMTSQVTGL